MSYLVVSAACTQLAMCCMPSMVTSTEQEREAFSGPLLYKVVSEYPLVIAVTEDLIYKDPDGRMWTLPKGALIRGHSLPRVIWNLNGGLVDQPHSIPLALYEYYVDTMSASWQETQEMLAHALRASGVISEKRTFYNQVTSILGKRWESKRVEDGSHENSVVSPRLDLEEDAEFYGHLTKAWALSDKNSAESRGLAASMITKRGLQGEPVNRLHFIIEGAMGSAILESLKRARDKIKLPND